MQSDKLQNHQVPSSAKLKGVRLDVGHTTLHSVSCFINYLIQPLFNILYKHKSRSLIYEEWTGNINREIEISFPSTM